MASRLNVTVGILCNFENVLDTTLLLLPGTPMLLRLEVEVCKESQVRPFQRAVAQLNNYNHLSHQISTRLAWNGEEDGPALRAAGRRCPRPDYNLGLRPNGSRFETKTHYSGYFRSVRRALPGPCPGGDVPELLSLSQI